MDMDTLKKNLERHEKAELFATLLVALQRGESEYD